MLVVIAIIALLSALLVPAVSNALQKAQHTKSMSNLRQWGNALYLYVVDSRGEMPSRGPDQQPSWSEASDRSQDEVKNAWFNRLPPYVSEKAIADIPSGEREFFLHRASMHRDPQAVFDESELPNRPLFSYAFNSQLNTSRAHGNSIPGLGDLRTDTLDISAYPNPTTTVLFFETRVGEDDGHPSQQSASQFARAYGHSRHLSFRYSGRVNLLFLDGSVRRFRSAELFNGTQVINDEVNWSGLN